MYKSMPAKSNGTSFLVYEPRFYRFWSQDKDLVSFRLLVEQSDILIQATKNLTKKAYNSIIKYREIIADYIKHNPVFATTLEPFNFTSSRRAPVNGTGRTLTTYSSTCPIYGSECKTTYSSSECNKSRSSQKKLHIPKIVNEMIKAGQKVNVGPMASVAGAIAEYVGKDLMKSSKEIIVENGGDIFMKISKPKTVGIYAGKSVFSEKLALEISPSDTPMGICTSSGTVGHSLSFGKADAVVILSKSTALADSCATATGNLIKTEKDIEKGVNFAKNISGITGVLIIKNDKISLWGNIKLQRIKK